MLNSILILVGKSVLFLSQKLKLGSGSTWPGHIAMEANPQFVSQILKMNPKLKVVLIAGTNGKTTTAKLVQEVLESEKIRVFRNAAGANLLNGIASSLIKHASIIGKINHEVAVFEVDENNLPEIISNIKSQISNISIILLNLFRDQLDRYGEVNSIAKKWKFAIEQLNNETILIINGDDPMLGFIGQVSNLQSFYFGLDEKLMEKKDAPHDADFLFCPSCESTLLYSKRSYSHMGIYKCVKCDFTHNKTATFADLPNPMLGSYNKYNINAATLLLEKSFGISEKQTGKVLKTFAPAFGRQEKIEYNGKNIFLLLSKNPTGFNQSIQAILKQEKKPNVLISLNDKIPDGRDVSWIWDVDFEKLKNAKYITVSGDRAYDMALRIKYCQIPNSQYQVFIDLKKSIEFATSRLKNTETLYVLTTYSTMLEARKILKGQAIL